MKYTHVFYSHTDFIDILQIASDYSKNIENKILLINNKELLPQDIVDNYNNIIVYDDSLGYSDKLAIVLKEIDSKYILFTHEVDIVLKTNNNILDKLVEFMEYDGVDRIDLQPNGGNNHGKYIKIDNNVDIPVEHWLRFDGVMDPYNQLSHTDSYLGIHDDPRSYIFNVNPSIWKKETFIELLTDFKGRTYRNIEYDDVQDYCTKYKIYNLYTRFPLLCGYLQCLDFYKYLHITHYGRFLRYDGKFRDEFNQSYKDAAKEYREILEKYELMYSNRPFS